MLSSIYLVKDDIYYKIGFSQNPIYRFSQLKVSNPREIVLIFNKEVNNVRKFEKQLHKMFAHKRHRGEWFILSDEDLLFIKVAIEMNVLPQTHTKKINADRLTLYVRELWNDKGLSMREIANILGLNKQNVHNLIHRKLSTNSA